MQQTQKFYIKTFGCQMNVADTERMQALLAEQGMTEAASADEASVIIVNGCTVREKAVHKAISTLGTYQDFKTGRPGEIDPKTGRPAPIIGVSGCVGQLEKKELFKRAPYVDFVMGTDALDNLPEILHRVREGERHVVYADFDKSMDYSTETKVHGWKAQAYVNIMKGCDKYCTYCIVPFTRGREKSRTIDEVVDDIASLVSRGVREVTLLGQNVNSFGKGNPNVKERSPQELNNRSIGKVGPRAGDENFPMLLRAIDSDPRCEKLKLIRFTSSHPLDFSDELIECYHSENGVKRLAKHLHLPVQSGSNRVLQKMGRHHQIEGYFAQMDHLREICPDVGLSTDLIVGFPTETEEDFQLTLRLLDRVQYDNIYAFAYSPRPGTRAAKMEDDVPDEVKKRRLNELLQYQLKIAEARYASRIGKELEILVEGEAKNQLMARGAATEGALAPESVARGVATEGALAPESVARGVATEGALAPESVARGVATEGALAPESVARGVATEGALAPESVARVWTGRTTCNRVVNFLSPSNRPLIGRFVPVRITAATSLSLQGELIEDPTWAERLPGLGHEDEAKPLATGEVVS